MVALIATRPSVLRRDVNMRHEHYKKVDVEVTMCLLLCLWLGEHGVVFVAVPLVARFQKWRFHDDSSSDTADQPISGKHSDDITF